MRQVGLFHRRFIRSPRVVIATLTFFAIGSLIVLRSNDLSYNSSPGKWPSNPITHFSPNDKLSLSQSIELSELRRKYQLASDLHLPANDDPSRGCIMPKITEYNTVYKNQGYKDSTGTRVVCAREGDWLTVSDGLIKFTNSSLEKYGSSSGEHMKCRISYIDRVDDFRQTQGKQTWIDSAVQLSHPLESDFLNVTCRTRSKSILKPTHSWKGLLAGIKSKQEVFERKDNLGKKHKLNILMFGFDSVSHVNFVKRLPKLYSYIINGLNGIVLDKYNIVGDGTTAAILGMLSGTFETELPETRRGKSSTHVDVYPFIWYDIIKERYVTLYAEDESNVGTFQYRLNGFKNQPTDHWMRPFQLTAENQHKMHKVYCLGSVPKINVLTNWIDELFKVYPSDIGKFVFGFHAEYSHGLVEELSLADEPITQWFMKLNSSGILNDTILIAMSDHGHRFSFSRSTLQGKYEERLPFFSIILPPWFAKVFPSSYKSLLINSLDRLTTPFDVHATLKSILNEISYGKDVGSYPIDDESPSSGSGSDATGTLSDGANGVVKGNLDEKISKREVNGKLPRGISLFKEIPLRRTCDDADISAHWCACNNWIQIDPPSSDHLAEKLAQELVNAINSAIIESEKDAACAHLSLASIKRAMKMQPKSALLSFKSSRDFDGRVPDLSDKTKVSFTMDTW